MHRNVSLSGHNLSVVNTATNIIMPSLSEKIGDNLQKIKQRAEDAFLTMAAHG